ncbi:MAG: TolC family protein, partial [Acidobacteriota bacterium]
MPPLAPGARRRSSETFRTKPNTRLASHALIAAALIAAPTVSARQPDAADELLPSLDPALRVVAVEVLDRSPHLEVDRARRDALRLGIHRAGALPDPMASATAFALSPETRVGPQRLTLGARQRLPSPARRELARDRARLDTDRATTAIAERRLSLLLRVRELWIEIAFLDEQMAILDDQRRHLALHEEAARARYGTGTGPASGPIRLQAEITRLQSERLGVEDRRAVLIAELAALRDRSAIDAELAIRPTLADPPAGLLDDILPISVDALVDRALDRRPEMAQAELARRGATIGVAVAETSGKPDVEVGLMWTAVEPRDDLAGRLDPPDGNGDDILAFTVGVNVPLHRDRRAAELAEAVAHEVVAGSAAHAVAVDLRRQVETLAARLPIEARQLALLRDVLLVQAHEAVDSAIAGD